LQTHGLLAAVDSSQTPVLQQRMSRLSRGVKRLSVLVDALFDVSRIRAGRLTLDPEPLDLAIIIRDCTIRAADALSRAGSRVELELEELLLGTWDRVRLEQVVDNLLSNAIKYGRGRPIVISAGTSAGRAWFRVRDQGHGISAEDQTRIFNRFERAAPPHNFGGLGLGLWVVRQVVEAHGGTVRVSSALDAGATFEVELPQHWVTRVPEQGCKGNDTVSVGNRRI